MEELNTRRDKLDTQLQEVQEENSQYSNTADATSTKIIPSLRSGRKEEQRSAEEQKRVDHLERELREVDGKLAEAEQRHDVIKQTHADGEEQMSKVEGKRDAGEEEVVKVEAEVWRLEKLVDTLGGRLEELKEAQVAREAELEEQRRMMEEEVVKVEEMLKKKTIHQAQSVSRKKK